VNLISACLMLQHFDGVHSDAGHRDFDQAAVSFLASA
jgi:hypothetical protein